MRDICANYKEGKKCHLNFTVIDHDELKEYRTEKKTEEDIF